MLSSMEKAAVKGKELNSSSVSPTRGRMRGDGWVLGSLAPLLQQPSPKQKPGGCDVLDPASKVSLMLPAPKGSPACGSADPHLSPRGLRPPILATLAMGGTGQCMQWDQLWVPALPRVGSPLGARLGTQGPGQPPSPGSLPHPRPGGTTFVPSLVRLQTRAEEIKIARCTNKSRNTSRVLAGTSPAKCPKGRADTSLLR